MKQYLLFLFTIFVCTSAIADTVNITWKNGNTTYDTSTCTIGNDLMVPPTPPTKPGYTFVGWQVKSAKELEYVTFQNNGFSYIDTGIKFDSDEIEYETKLKFASYYLIAFGPEGGCTGYGNVANSSGSLASIGQSCDTHYKAGNTLVSGGNACSAVNTHNLYIKKSTNTVRGTFNDTVSSGTLSGTISTDKNIRIGQLNLTESYPVRCGFVGNIYYFRIKKDGVLVLDLIPAKDPDGVVCFYDRVSKTFFYNQYGADLVAGPEVQ